MFMEQFGVGPHIFGVLFAVMAAGFIGASQFNVWLLRHFRSDQIFAWAVRAQALSGLVFLICALGGWLGLIGTAVLLFIVLACVGVGNPNGSALALAPFSRDAGSASALMGALQLGTGALISTSIGIIGAKSGLPIVAILCGTGIAAALIHAAVRSPGFPGVEAAEKA